MSKESNAASFFLAASIILNYPNANPVQNKLSRTRLRKKQALWVEGCVWWCVTYITFNFLQGNLYVAESLTGKHCGFNGPCCKQTKRMYAN